MLPVLFLGRKVGGFAPKSVEIGTNRMAYFLAEILFI